ncbi:MAG: hypothetical protein IPM17_11080 [Verrucomicrobia bacterium]|nr:hypothetical protein [Verrucomicrobiota bacterium]
MKFIGHPIFERLPNGEFYRGPATLIVSDHTLTTDGPSHAEQIANYLQRGAPRPAEGQDTQAWHQLFSLVAEKAACLFVEADSILIRPDPDNMELAFAADEQLQAIVPKWRIRYLYPHHPKVIEAMRKRGELWRIAPLPRSLYDIKALIESSRVALGGLKIYFQNRITGTRFLTYAQFAALGQQPDAVLRQHLVEIAEYSRRRNLSHNPEVSFFAVDEGINAERFAAVDWAALDDTALRAEYEKLRAEFEEAVSNDCVEDDLNASIWRERMYTTLVSPPDELLSDHVLQGLSSEFFLKIEWLAGASFVNNELIFDPALTAFRKSPEDPILKRVCSEHVRGLIRNFYRELGDLEYINIGRIAAETSIEKGRREVYIAQIKPVGAERQVKIIRFQRWDISIHLRKGNWPVLDALVWANDYTNFVMNRRLGCRQLGMRLAPRVTVDQLPDDGTFRLGDKEVQIWATYFVRDFVWGVATDKVPKYKLSDEAYSLRLARLLGEAAALNLIAGRTDDAKNAIFDAGDEVIQEGPDGLPAHLVITDHGGTFKDWTSPLTRFAAAYARPVNSRAALVPRKRRFARAYLAGLRERFLEVQREYSQHPEAFTRLFEDLPRQVDGDFAARWADVLHRMQTTQVDELCREIRRHITVSDRPGEG